MELYAVVQPLVLTLDDYEQIYGEDDPEELVLLQLQDRELATRITGVLRDLYFLETDLDQPRSGEGMSEEVGTLEDFRELRGIAAASLEKTVDDYHEGRVPAGFQYNHLINHHDTSGYYLPVEFPQAFVLEELSLGSSTNLLQELDALTPILSAQFPAEMSQAFAAADEEEPDPIPGPVGVWRQLRRFCQSSLEMGLPIHFG